MERIVPNRFDEVFPLVRKAEITSHLSVAHAVLEGRQTGEVYVNRAADPQFMLVISVTGFHLLFGETDQKTFAAFLPQLLANPLFPKSGLYATSPAWARLLEAHFGTCHRRIGYEFTGTIPQNKTSPEISFPWELTPLVAKDSLQWEGLDSWIFDVWGGPRGFARDSFGWCLKLEGKPVSFCAAGSIGNGEVEIEIGTVPSHRGKGLGAIVGEQFIRDCIERGLRPAWSADSRNAASRALARKLGFVEHETVTGAEIHPDLQLTGGKWVTISE